MNEKDFTRIGTIRAISRFFDGVQDDDHALFVFETMGEFPDNQLVSAIDIAGAVPNYFYMNYSFKTFSMDVQARVETEAESAKLNYLLREMA